MIADNITAKIIGSAIRVHRKLGPGLLESTYRECLSFELTRSGWHVEKEKPLPIIYEGIRLEHGYRIDLLVENQVVIEIKTVEEFASVHYKQLLTYLKLGNYKVGLLINFYVYSLKYGIKRMVN
jgi:GxxExxY protein